MPNYVGPAIFCKNRNCSHFDGLKPIWLPSPIRREIPPHPTVLAMAKPCRTMFRCPECEQLFDYTKDDVIRIGREVTGNFQPENHSALACLDFVCAAKNCGIPVRICTPADSVSSMSHYEERVRKFAAQVSCSGHSLVLPDVLKWPPYTGPVCQIF